MSAPWKFRSGKQKQHLWWIFLLYKHLQWWSWQKNDAEEDDVRDNIKYGDDQNEQKNDEDENVEGKDLGDKKMNKWRHQQTNRMKD